MTCKHLDWGSKYDFRSHQKLQPHQIDHHIETNDEGEVQITGIRFDIHKRWHVDWISSTTRCHIRPMQTFSLLSFILESGWPCIHLDWGSKYDLRSRQKNHPVKTGNDYIIAPKYDWTTPGPGDGKIMERALFQGRCKYGNGNSKARIMERECFECCVKERCAVKFVSLRNRRKWIYCEPGCKGFCNA